jgi:GTP-binding protein
MLYLIYCLFLNLWLVDAFIIPIPLTRHNHGLALALQMAKRGGGPTAGAAGGPSKTGHKKNNNSKQSAKKVASKSTTSRAAQMNNKKKQSSHAPPWQVVSKNDLAKNAKAEKERRTLAKQGIHNVKEDVDYSLSKSFLSNEDKSLLAWKRFAQAGPKDEIEFIGAYLNEQLPPRLGAPEVAFLGRSNVGKSSLLNQLVNSDMARVGKTPGATASVNLYGIFRKYKALLGLVDLPGFGYAKLSKESKESVQMAAEKYLGKRKELFLGILLVDIRRVPSEDDRAVLAALYDMAVPLIVVATKVDKLSKSQKDDALEGIRNGLGLPEGQPYCVSSATGEGIKGLWTIIMEACEAGVQDLKTKTEQGGEEKDKTRVEGFEEDNDDDEIAYNQGYDWIHDSESVMYEGDEVEEFGDLEIAEEKEKIVNDGDPNQRLSLKFFRKKAKEMEKRGEFKV